MSFDYIIHNFDQDVAEHVIWIRELLELIYILSKAIYIHSVLIILEKL